jgi:broad specificity polyphosphatase/5'/3'-nucleotidase SurE
VAFSAGSMSEWAPWKAEVMSPEARPDWERLADLCADLVVELEAAGLPELADVVSVNVPFDGDSDTPRRITTIARTGYDRLFRQEGEGTFVHEEFGGAIRHFEVGTEGTDVDAAHHGVIAISPVRMPEAVHVPEEVRRRIEG